MARDDLEVKLADAGKRHRAAMEAKQAASVELAKLVPRAARAGLTPVEILRLTGLSRQRVYELTHARSASKR